MVALVVKPVQLLGQALGIIEAKDTGCALADDDRADLGPGAACHHPLLRQKVLEGRDTVIGDAGDLHRHPGGKGNGTAAEFFGGLPHLDQLPGGKGTVFGDDAPVKLFGSPVQEEALSLYSFDFFRFQRHFLPHSLDNIVFYTIA